MKCTHTVYTIVMQIHTCRQMVWVDVHAPAYLPAIMDPATRGNTNIFSNRSIISPGNPATNLNRLAQKCMQEVPVKRAQTNKHQL